MTKEEALQFIGQSVKSDVDMAKVAEALKVLERDARINKPCIAEKLCEHYKSIALEKIRAEIDKARFVDKDTRICKNALASGLEVAMQIIDKYKAETEKEE